MTDKTTILKVKNLDVELDNRKIIDDLSFEVKRGETLVILGPNGAGKSVLLKTLLNLLPYEGEIKWGKDIKIGYVPQRLPFIKNIPLSVREFFELKSTKNVGEVLDLVGLNISVENQSVGTLSSGQFQRVLIAWALINDPEVLFFDEPTSGIDIGGEETIHSLLSDLKKKRELTIFLVTHDLNVVYQEANNVLCLNHKKLCYGLPQEVLTSQNIEKLFGGNVKFFEHNH
ncbi:metal ABC transporter ATP-binding protein [Patescibacteria group bacterium]|nr:metal ABC transporter ATP-binding protein [Patescibacteria group bacterium]MBU2633566.1 metal ABC transporter ATP-binding protein [Patescibacteria group bacterium]